MYNMISSMESNWMTDLETVQRLGEEITPFTCSIKEVCEQKNAHAQLLGE